MCIGIPMQVAETGLVTALCRNGEEVETIDTALVGPLEAGDWVMVFLGAAREKISAEYAQQCRNALTALDMAMRGETRFDHLFADLIGREPELPDFLKPDTQTAAGMNNASAKQIETDGGN